VLPARPRGPFTEVSVRLAFETGHSDLAAILLGLESAEPYVIAPPGEELRIMAQTVRTISIRAYGEGSTLKLDVPADTPASALWALRTQTSLTLRGASEDSEAALTPISQRPGTADGGTADGGTADGGTAFVGTGFVMQRSLNLNAVRCTPAGERTDCSAVARWVAFREAGTPSLTQWIFWLRGDIAALASGSR